MDLWDYLKGLRRWWWLVVIFPAIAALLLQFVIVPPARYQTSWTTVVTFRGNPSTANSVNYVDFIVLDDMEQLLHSGVVGDLVYRQLPPEMTAHLSRQDLGAMYRSFRHARFVQIWVSGDDPAIVTAVTAATQRVLPEAVNTYLIPPDYAPIPGTVEIVTPAGQPVQHRAQRLARIGVATAGALLVGLVAAGVAEWLRLSWRAKYRATGSDPSAYAAGGSTDPA